MPSILTNSDVCFCIFETIMNPLLLNLQSFIPKIDRPPKKKIIVKTLLSIINSLPVTNTYNHQQQLLIRPFLIQLTIIATGFLKFKV